MEFSWFWNRTTKSSYILVLLVLEQDYKVHFHERHGILSLLEQDYKVVKTNILEHETKEEKAHRVGVDDAAVDVEDGLHAVADGDAKVGVVGVRLIGQQRQRACHHDRHPTAKTKRSGDRSNHLQLRRH